MTIKKIAIIASLLMASSCLCCGAQAAQLGTYVGGGVGYSKRDFDEASLVSDRDFLLEQFAYTVVEQGASSTVNTGIGYWATLGYRATAHLAFEGTYSKLSSFEYKSEATQGFSVRPDFSTNPPTPVSFPGPSTTKFKVEDSVLQIDGLYIFPRGYRWEFYGRAGLSVATTKVQVQIFEPAATQPHRGQLASSSTTYHAGIGLTYSLLEVYGVRVEYNHTFGVGGDVVSGKHDVDSLTLGVIVAF